MAVANELWQWALPFPQHAADILGNVTRREGLEIYKVAYLKLKTKN